MMERSEGSSFAAAVEDSDTVKRSLREAVTLMHQNNYVHGDLRQQNILVVNDKVHILIGLIQRTLQLILQNPELNMDEHCKWHPMSNLEERYLKSMTRTKLTPSAILISTEHSNYINSSQSISLACIDPLYKYLTCQLSIF